MNSERNDNGSNFKDLIIKNLRDKVENRRYDFLNIINSASISLFWEIGTLIDNQLKEDQESNKEKIITNISNHLLPTFGNYFSTKNLYLMWLFANKCTLSTMKNTSVAINWEYLSYLLTLEDEKALIFYIELIHIKNLNPKQLRDEISKDTFATYSLKENNGYKASIPTKNSLFYQNTIEIYFGKKHGGEFSKLFEPKENYEILNKLKSKNIDSEIIINIYKKVLDFQLANNHLLNILFNSIFWEIGTEIILIAKTFNTPVDELIRYCVFHLSSDFPFIFQESTLSNIVKFAEKHTDQPIELLQTVSWPYLKMLLEISDKDKQILIAQQILSQNMTIEATRELITKNLNDLLISINFNHAVPKFHKSTTKRIKEKNNTLVITEEIIDPILNPKNDINRNIYKNTDLLRFLKAVKV